MTRDERIVSLLKRLRMQIGEWDHNLRRETNAMIDELAPPPVVDPNTLYRIFVDLADSPEANIRLRDATDRYLESQKKEADFFANILPPDMPEGIREMLTGEVYSGSDKSDEEC